MKDAHRGHADADSLGCREEGFQAGIRGMQKVRSGDVPDTPVPQGEKMLHGFADALVVVHMDDGDVLLAGRHVDEDHGNALRG